MVPKKITSLLIRYLIVGVLSVAIDASVYYICSSLILIGPNISKRISFIIGGTWSFLANKFFTFNQKEARIKEPFVFVGVYLFGFFINGCVHDITLSMWNIKALSFLLATGVSTVTNFLGQKFIVFAEQRSPNDSDNVKIKRDKI